MDQFRTPGSPKSPGRSLYPTKSFDHLSGTHQAEIKQWKNEFSDYSQILRMHLSVLGVPQLEPYLAWIPPNKFYGFVQLAEGGFAKVYKAEVVLSGRFFRVAAKQLRPSMVPEVSSILVICSFSLSLFFFSFLSFLFFASKTHQSLRYVLIPEFSWHLMLT